MCGVVDEVCEAVEGDHNTVDEACNVVDEDREAVDGDLLFAGTRILDVGRKAGDEGNVFAGVCSPPWMGVSRTGRE